MINSRDINMLNPAVKQKAQQLISECQKQGVDLLITSTLRDDEAQAVLYAQGRSTPGRVVTNAKPGESFHNYGMAFDVVPLVHGKAVWDDNVLWGKIGGIAEGIGLEWGWRWKSFQEKPHFQYTNGLSIKSLQAMKAAHDAIPK